MEKIKSIVLKSSVMPAKVLLLHAFKMRETNRMLSWSTRREKALIKLQLMQSEK